MTIHGALSKLEGLAKTWYQGLPSVDFTWLEWKIKLRGAFPPSKGFHQKLLELMARKKLPNETFAQYYYEKLALVNACEFEGDKAVDCIIGDINDQSVINSARAGKFKKPEELFAYLSTVQVNSVKASHTFAKKSGSSQNAGSSVVVCHKCHKKGHIARNCFSANPAGNVKSEPPRSGDKRSEKRCNYCRRLGHVEAQCFQKKSQTNSSKIQ